MAEGKTSVTHLADEVGSSRQEPDDLLFAKTKLTEANLSFRRRTQFFDAYCHSRFHSVQGAGIALDFRPTSPESHFAGASNSGVSVCCLRCSTNRLGRRVSFR